jgi:hypothetical protein
MKKALPFILILFTIVNLFTPLTPVINGNSLTLTKTVAEAGDCKFVSASLDPHKGYGNYLPTQTGKVATLIIQTTPDCVNQLISGTIIERDKVIQGGNNPVLDFTPKVISGTSISIAFKPGEKHCESGQCEIIFELYLGDASSKNKWDTYTSKDDQELDYACLKTACDQDINWALQGVAGINTQTQLTAIPSNTKDSITITGTGPSNGAISANDILTVSIFDSSNKLLSPGSVGGKNPIIYNVLTNLSNDQGKTIAYSATFSGLTPETAYVVTITPEFSDSNLQILNRTITLPISTLNAQGQPVADLPGPASVNDLNQNQNQGSVMPACSIVPIWGDGTLAGCAAQLLYYVLFVPTSFVFALTGKFFDFTFQYSVTDTSYRSAFVVQGWGIVRDFCNIFFIFVLLYVAFATILNLHGFKTKEMIVNVVVIGILINFSMFAAELIIDASNILARVFYNSDAIKITVQPGASTSNPNDQKNLGNGVTNILSTPGPNGEIQLSAAIVNKINPQNLIINSNQVGTIPDKGQVTKTQDDQNNLGVGTFILITLLATAVNLVGIVVFLSVGLIFVARVIGLWFCMILAPLAFFSYTVPSMQSVDLIGWKKWWPELLNLSFLAPIFIFFLYLILKFLDTGLSLISSNHTDGLTFVISIVIPFVFIMVLLMKAKGLAKKFSGEMGQAITGGIAAVGGVALGAATGGAAFLGRGTIGRIANKVDKSDWLNNAAAGKTGNAFTQRLAKFGKKATTKTASSSFDVRQTAAGNAFSKEMGMNLNAKGLGALGLDTKAGLGGYKGVKAREVEKENKFAESLGHDHHQEVVIQDEIDKKKVAVSEAEKKQSNKKADAQLVQATNNAILADKTATKAEKKAASERIIAAQAEYTAAQKEVTTLKAELAGEEKNLERSKTARQTEYALTKKRKSGKIYGVDEVEKEYKEAKAAFDADPTNHDKEHAFVHAKEHRDQYRDKYDNIKKFGHAEDLKGAERYSQAGKEAMEGFVKGMVAGSVIPGVGTLIGGLAGATRELMKYSGTSNRQVGEKHGNEKHEEPKDNYKPGSSGGGGGGHAPAAGGDHGGDHGGGDHGGGGHGH